MVQAGLYCIQITLAYFLMLIAMTYNTYLTAAVVLGAGFGHWLFALIQDSAPAANVDTVDAVSSDACHWKLKLNNFRWSITSIPRALLLLFLLGPNVAHIFFSGKDFPKDEKICKHFKSSKSGEECSSVERGKRN